MKKKIRIIFVAILLLISGIIIYYYLFLNKKMGYQKLETPISVVWTGEVEAKMTYARLLIKQSANNEKYPEFIAEPLDVNGDGPYVESSTTINISQGDLIKITGKWVATDCENWGEGSRFKKNQCVPWIEIEKIDNLSAEDTSAWPTIKSSELPPNLFDAKGDFIDYGKEKYSFLYNGIVGDNGKYTKVAVEDSPIEKPVSISYLNEHRPLNLKSDIEINEIVIDAKEDEIGMQSWRKRIAEQLLEYGQISRQYLPDYAITNYYEVDVDNDGIKEKLITFCRFGANHCSNSAEIIRGNEIIFSTQFYDNSRGIKPAQTGFYVDWTDEDSFRDDNGNESGLCCELSHNRTLFQFQNGKFTAIKQWEVPHIWKRVVDE